MGLSSTLEVRLLSFWEIDIFFIDSKIFFFKAYLSIEIICFFEEGCIISKKKLKNCILMRDSLITTKCLYEVKNRRTYISLSYVIDMVNVLKEPWQRKMLSWEKVQTKNMAWKSIKVFRFLNLRNMSSWTKVVIGRVKSFFLVS